MLFVLNQREQGLFFGPEVRELLAESSFEVAWANDRDLEESRWEKVLREARPDILVTCWSTPPLPEAWLGEPDCPLAYICHVTGTVRDIIPRSYLERGGKVTNWGGLAGRDVAEHALLLGLAALRRMPLWKGLCVKAGGKPGSVLLETRTMHGRRVGLHGFGSVARSLVQLLKPFNVALAAYSRGVPGAAMRAAGVEPCQTLEELFSRSEVVFEVEALTPESMGSVNERTLAALPDGAVFVNVGRGHVTEEAALMREAASGRIHMALDVLWEEPPPLNPPIGRFSNVLVSPHIAGPTYETLPECGIMALRNIERYLRGERLEAEVDLNVYDRST